MNANWKWTDLDLADYAGGLLTDAPTSPGIYVWRLRFGTNLDHSLPTMEFLKLLQEQLGRPSGRMPAVQLGTTLRLGEVEIGGGRLSDDKVEFLHQQFGKPGARKRIASYCQSIDRFSPVIYVGKSLNLRDRLAQHQSGQTDLKEYVYEALGRQWRDLCVSYLALPDELTAEPDRTGKLLSALEMIAQLALAPHGVKRRG